MAELRHKKVSLSGHRMTEDNTNQVTVMMMATPVDIKHRGRKPMQSNTHTHYSHTHTHTHTTATHTHIHIHTHTPTYPTCTEAYSYP